MLNVRALLIGALVVGLTACGGGNKQKKMSIGKNQRAQGQVSDWTTDKDAYAKLMGKDDKGKPTCLILPNLLNLITGVGDNLVSVHASDFDFVQTTGGEAQDANEPRMESVSGDVTLQKAAYFFKGTTKQKIYEVQPGKEIVGSFQIHDLMVILEQSGCSTVVFMGPTPGSTSRFQILGGKSPNSIRLVGTSLDVVGERRTYSMLNRGQILITVSKVVRDVPSCGIFPKERRIRKSYLVGRVNEQSRALVSSSFARFLDNAVYSVPEIKNALDKKNDKDKAKAQEKVTARGATLSDRITVSYPTLTYLQLMIDAGQGKLKDNNCAP